MKRAALAALAACSSAPHPAPPPRGVVIDRFSAAAGHLMVRDGKRALPGPDEPIDLGKPPFITQAFGPDGSVVRYYNFDVQSATPATLYRLVRGDQHLGDIVDVIPGDPGYSDFFRIVRVDVPDGAVPASASELRDLPQHPEPRAIDCPIVPRGTREAPGATRATPLELLYRGERVTCLQLGEPLDLEGDRVPTSPIYVTFNASSGFRTEGATRQTHNVVFSVPGDVDYSPLWDVHIYDPRAFDLVHDSETALRARLVEHGPLVNCPIVYQQPRSDVSAPR